MYFRTCTSGAIVSCNHTAEEVLNYSGSIKLEEKINESCDDNCESLKETAIADAEYALSEAAAALSQEQETIEANNAHLATLEQLINDGAAIDSMVSDIEASVFEETVQNDLATIKSGQHVDEEEVKKNVLAGIAIRRFKNHNNLQILESKMSLLKANVKSSTNVIKKFSSPGNVAKGARAMASLGRAFSRFKKAGQGEEIDPWQATAGVLDLVDTVATFAPPPVSILTGKYTAAFLLCCLSQVDYCPLRNISDQARDPEVLQHFPTLNHSLKI